MAEMDFTQVEAHLSALAENLASDFGDAVSVTRAPFGPLDGTWSR